MDTRSYLLVYNSLRFFYATAIIIIPATDRFPIRKLIKNFIYETWLYNIDTGWNFCHNFLTLFKPPKGTPMMFNLCIYPFLEATAGTKNCFCINMHYLFVFNPVCTKFICKYAISCAHTVFQIWTKHVRVIFIFLSGAKRSI